MKTIQMLMALYRGVFSRIEALLGDVLPGFLARLVFASTLSLYFFNSAMTKTGDGLFGFFQIQPAAWYQIAPQAVDAALGDIDAISFFPWGIMVLAGTYAEYLLPLMVVAGLFTRLSALGMIGFVAVQTLVDIFVHKVDAATIGLPFDRFPDAVIADQRLFWLFLLVIIVIKGPGMASLDGFLAPRFEAKPKRSARSRTARA